MHMQRKSKSSVKAGNLFLTFLAERNHFVNVNLYCKVHLAGFESV